MHLVEKIRLSQPLTFGGITLARADVLSLSVPSWLIWVIVGFLCMSVVADVITPSAAGRALWLPVILAMLDGGLVVTRS
jgi:hypothetical protein